MRISPEVEIAFALATREAQKRRHNQATPGLGELFSMPVLDAKTLTQAEIIRKYAPAITATGSGLFMALLNLLPAWVVTIGRDLILTLAAGPADDGGPS